jgi:three-Cys-motif partner protein
VAVPTKTTWKAEPHTLAKIAILEGYLGAWYGILAPRGDVLYFDGFAGPGSHTNSPGSPLVALSVAAKHRMVPKGRADFVLVEKDPKRAEHLAAAVDRLTLPRPIRCAVKNEECRTALERLVDRLPSSGGPYVFAFIDPFGTGGVPFELIRELMQRDRCEVFVTYMVEQIRRWATRIPDTINELIGNPNAADLIARSDDRAATARHLYAASLESVARHVRPFRMHRSARRPVYDLFFATGHQRGFVCMKEAMWKVSDSDELSFTGGGTAAQGVLFAPEPERDLAILLWNHFRGQTVLWEAVRDFTEQSDHYIAKHARGALKLLEREGGFERHRIEVADTKVDGSRRNRNTFPAGTQIMFVDG